MSMYDKARAAELDQAVIVGRDQNGKIQLFIEDADREKLIVLLERAKAQLVKSMDG